MSIARQLYRLQEVELGLESSEKAIKQLVSQLGESEALVRTRSILADEQKRLEELKRQQHSLEWEVDDITTKLKTTEDKLYSGRIGNPKELSGLEQEARLLKNRRHQLEDKDLEIMEQVEQVAKAVADLESEYQEVEAGWRNQQQGFSAQLEQLEETVAELKQRRESLCAEIEPPAIEIYREIKKKKGTGVARVEQGICQGCRISLPVSELQQARGNNLVRCSSCGRILFLA